MKVEGWKFEQFLFDPFDQVENLAILEIAREEDFSPLKNPPGRHLYY